MFRIYDGRNEFYQWDLDRKLIVKDASITEVHFCNKLGDCALVCEVYTEGAFRVVDVPNILLQTVWRIRAYGYTDNHTEYETYFDIKPRTKPADYIYTETEVKRYEAFEERLAALEEKEVDLTGYATEEFVNTAITDNAPNWNAQSNYEKGYIENRTHYTERVVGAQIDGEIAEGTTRIIDLSKSSYSKYLQYFSPEYQKEKYCDYPISCLYDLKMASSSMGVMLNITNVKYLENTTNYYYTLIGDIKLYVITDRNSLSDELKERFSTNGIYTHTDKKRAETNKWCANFIYEMRLYRKTLDYGFLPAKFLEAADKEEIMAAIGNVGGADWAQNDESAKDYIKNRTHYEYEEIVGEDILFSGKASPTVTTKEYWDYIYETRETLGYFIDGSVYSYLEDRAGYSEWYVGNQEKRYKISKATRTNNGVLQYLYSAYDEENKQYVSFKIGILMKETITKKLDSKYLPDYVTSPLLLDTENAEVYLNDSFYGEEALEAIKHNRQILVKVPNASGDNYVVNYSPVYMYQVPNYENEYLYIFFLSDEKNRYDLTAIGVGVVEMPIYGQLKMKLSQKYNNNPLITE